MCFLNQFSGLLNEHSLIGRGGAFQVLRSLELKVQQRRK